ncbi:MAG TPA: hypothetical protein VM468_12055 [Mycoplana sp.]|nr:hypothetical protein [Mycoplana sp.]
MTFPLALATIAVLVLMSTVAARRIAPGVERLTMQWKWNGKPNWSLPRNGALAVTPALAAVVLAIVALSGETRAAMLLVCIAFIGVHALHLFLLAKRGG